MQNQFLLQVKKLTPLAILPKRGSPGAAGYDLCASKESVVPAHGKALIKTDISIAVPTGNYARIAPRSGLAWKNFIDVGAGVIDEDYRGEVGVLLFNHSDQDFQVTYGDRIAQMIIEKITVTEIEEVETLEDSVRGAGGFGSTGVSLNQNKIKTLDVEAVKQTMPILSAEEKRKQLQYENLLKEVQVLFNNQSIDEDLRLHLCAILRKGNEQDINKLIEVLKASKSIEQLQPNFSEIQHGVKRLE